MNFNDVAIFSIKGNDFGIWYMSKYEAINLMKNSDFKKNWIYIIFFLIYKKSMEQLIMKELNM